MPTRVRGTACVLTIDDLDKGDGAGRRGFSIYFTGWSPVDSRVCGDVRLVKKFKALDVRLTSIDVFLILLVGASEIC